MARIVCISKYPPLEGGIAAKTYWLTKALGERGHEVHIVTDSPDVSSEYAVSSLDRPAPLQNVTVHRPEQEVPWHIPEDQHRALSLLDKALQVIDHVKPDIIDTGYLVPYGLVGYHASLMTGVPFVLRHGGSDLAKFVSQGIWQALFDKAFRAASLIITDHSHLTSFQHSKSKLIAITPYVPNPGLFYPRDRSINSPPVLAIVGKANYYWRHKGWHRVAEIIDSLGSKFKYLVMSRGKGFDDFKKFMVKNGLSGKIEWEPLIHPSDMPALLHRIDGLFGFESDLPFPAFSNLVLEAIYSGVTIITDTMTMLERYRMEGLDLDVLKGSVLTVNTCTPEHAAEQIMAHFDKSISHQFQYTIFTKDYDRYLIDNEDALGLVLSKSSSI